MEQKVLLFSLWITMEPEPFVKQPILLSLIYNIYLVTKQVFIYASDIIGQYFSSTDLLHQPIYFHTNYDLP